MASNPILNRAEKPISRDLDEFVANANNNWFVQASGKPYFVAQRVNPADGTLQRYVDRAA